MRVHLIDGTYELFRQFYSPRPKRQDADGVEIGAARALVASVLAMLDEGATHIGVATDHVIESFRNRLYAGYKTGEGVDPLLKGQFHIAEDALIALGVTVWPMVEHEADDGLASAAAAAAADDRVELVLICTPDKDLAQCVGGKVVQVVRGRDGVIDADGVRSKYGVSPESIPDWLALVGDSADGFPGLPGWGAKSAAAVLSRYVHLEQIPLLPERWEVPDLRGGKRLAGALAEGRDDAMLFKDLATLRTGLPTGEVDEWRWQGPTGDFAAWCERFGRPEMAAKAAALAAARAQA